MNFALPTGDGEILRQARAAIAGAALDDAQRQELADLDETVIESLVTSEIQDYLLADDPAQPLTNWWWHLGAIHARRYPSDLLPENLRAVYLA